MDINSKLMPKTVTDFSGFESLKSAAQNHDPQATKAVAKQFEALFLQMMLKDMRKAATSFGDSFLRGSEEEYYTELFDKEISLKMAETKGFGLAAVIERQLSKPSAAQDVNAKPIDISVIERNIKLQAMEAVNSPKMATPSVDKLDTKEAVQKTGTNSLLNFSTPEEFIKNLMPLAKEFSKKLGVSPEMLLAQAALETGWGKTIKDKVNNNLFGIKATQDWSGKSVVQNTIEFEQGILTKKNEAFRTYDTLRESFQDYVDFLQGNKRYQEALKNVHSPEDFAKALQDAGYATDPHYAKKIMQIYDKMG